MKFLTYNQKKEIIENAINEIGNFKNLDINDNNFQIIFENDFELKKFENTIMSKINNQSTIYINSILNDDIKKYDRSMVYTITIHPNNPNILFIGL